MALGSAQSKGRPVKFKKSLVAAVITLGGIGGSFATAAAQATEEGTGADCPSGYFCMWVDSNYNGARYQVSWQTIIDGPNNGIGVGWITDIASSMYNRTPYTIRMHAHDNCGTLGWSRPMPSGQKLTAPGSAVNDRVEALQFESAYPLPC